MVVRYTHAPSTTGTSNKFNLHGLGEVVVQWKDASASSERISDLEVEISGRWMPLSEAFHTKDVITDNHNVYFFEPRTQEDRERGYTLI